jgi:hypothetical protein
MVAVRRAAPPPSRSLEGRPPHQRRPFRGQSGPTHPLPQWGVKPTRAALASPAYVMAIATWDKEHKAFSGDVWMEGFCHLFT